MSKSNKADSMAASAVEQAMLAIKHLASQCDWACARDGVGFAGPDAPLGHALAQKDAYSKDEGIAAIQLTIKYRGQVERARLEVGAVSAYIKAHTAEIADARRLRKREIVTGNITVRDELIVLSTSFSRSLVYSIKQLFIGCTWDPETKEWSAPLCAENVFAAESIAREFGLTIKKNKKWSSYPKIRKLEICGSDLVFRGFSRNSFGNRAERLDSRSGRPARDELIFDADRWIDRTTFAVSLTSWNIQKMTLWLETGNVKEALGEELKKETQSLIADAYPLAWAREAESQGLSTALGLPDKEVAELRAKLPASMAENMMRHQWVAVKWMLQNRQCIVADQQGLGKTLEALAALEAANAFPAIVVCPAVARGVWAREIQKWLPGKKTAVLGLTTKKDAGCATAEADIIVVNYESFEKNKDDMAQRKPVAVICDEAQYLKTYDSKRTEAVKDFLQQAAPDYRIMLTGTPIINRPSELMTLLTLLPQVLSAMGGFIYFAARYCKATLIKYSFSSRWDYSGEDNLDELNLRLRQTALIRREKKNVLQIAPKQISWIDVEISNQEEYTEASTNFSGWLQLKIQNRPEDKKKAKPNKSDDADGDVNLLHEIGEIYGYEDVYFGFNDDARHEALRRLGALRQLNGSGKVQAAAAWINKLLSVKDEKLVVFAYHKEVQIQLAENFPGCLTITGEQSYGARESVINQFQTDPCKRLIICSIKSSQTAITLHAARHVLFVEMDWTPAGLEQAEDRTHRIGQSKQVEVTYLVAKGTTDDRMLELLTSKRSIISSAVTVGDGYGHKKNGIARLQQPGPGRPRLNDDERKRRRKASKAGWQARNNEYMRDYMQKRRQAVKDNIQE